jgi:hypothetical protein
LKEMALLGAVPIESLRKCAQPPFHARDQVGLRRQRRHMKVVGHDRPLSQINESGFVVCDLSLEPGGQWAGGRFLPGRHVAARLVQGDMPRNRGITTNHKA